MYYRQEFEDVEDKVEAFDLESINEYSIEKEATKEAILGEAVNKKYSTFDLYGDEEFKNNLSSFQNWLNGNTIINFTRKEALFNSLKV